MRDEKLGWKTEFVNSSCFRLDENLRMVRKSFNLLPNEDIWRQPNPSSNSMGNLVLHLRGNITQYVISSLGGVADIRERDSEFYSNPGYTKKKLLELLAETVNEAKAAINHCGVDDLLRVRKVQGFSLSGIGIVIHVVEHFSYHTGQIAFWTKLLKDRDLGFHDENDLNIRNG